MNLPYANVGDLICPRCLRLGAREQRLNSNGSCPCCGALYSVRDGIPLLQTDERISEGFASRKNRKGARARFYDRNESYLRENVEGGDKVKAALARVLTNGTVLEIGSGRGTFAGLGGLDYCALDYSLSHLRKYLGGYRRICASAEAIPLPSESCRLVFSFATLEHVPRPDLAFSEVHRVLAVGGVACLAPAWHCRDWAADGLSVRPYRDLSWRQRIRKSVIPLRDSIIYRGIRQIPWRIWRRVATELGGAPSRLSYRGLKANYERFWQADSDACSCIDSHEGVLFFYSRNYEILEPQGGVLAQLLFRAGAVIARKTPRSTGE